MRVLHVYSTYNSNSRFYINSLLKRVPLCVIINYLLCISLQIDAANNDTELGEILDDSTNMAIINSSSWPVTKSIDCKTKFQLGQTLLIEEVLHKCEANIRALRRGMDVLGFFKLCSKYPEKNKEALPPHTNSTRFITILFIDA